jgi:hypothetical protein
MTNQEQLIRARMAILIMAAELKNVAKVCRLAGVSRSQFYAMKKAYERNGKEGLAPRLRRKPVMPNRTPPMLEEQILLNTRQNPTFSYIRLSGEMESDGIGVSPSMVRYVWQRHGLSTRSARLEWTKGFTGEKTASPKHSDNSHNVPAAGQSVFKDGDAHSLEGRQKRAASHDVTP